MSTKKQTTANKSSQQKCFFARQAFTLQTGQNHGLQLFCPTSFAPTLGFSKNLLCPCNRTAHHRSDRFRPKLFR